MKASDIGAFLQTCRFSWGILLTCYLRHLPRQKCPVSWQLICQHCSQFSFSRLDSSSGAMKRPMGYTLFNFKKMEIIDGSALYSHSQCSSSREFAVYLALGDRIQVRKYAFYYQIRCVCCIICIYCILCIICVCCVLTFWTCSVVSLNLTCFKQVFYMFVILNDGIMCCCIF